MLYVYMHMKLAYEYFNAWIDKHLWSTGISVLESTIQTYAIA